MRERVIVFENYIAAKDQQKSKQRCSMEVYRREALARCSQHAPHDHDRASRSAPACPPRRAHSHPRSRATLPAPLPSISSLRFAAATTAPTQHCTHLSPHAGRRCTALALTALALATAATADTTLPTLDTDLHTVPNLCCHAATMQHHSHASAALQSHTTTRALGATKQPGPRPSARPPSMPCRILDSDSAPSFGFFLAITTTSPLLQPPSSSAISPPSVGFVPSPLKQLKQMRVTGFVPRPPKRKLPRAVQLTEPHETTAITETYLNITETTETIETTEPTETTADPAPRHCFRLVL